VASGHKSFRRQTHELQKNLVQNESNLLIGSSIPLFEVSCGSLPLGASVPALSWKRVGDGPEEDPEHQGMKSGSSSQIFFRSSNSGFSFTLSPFAVRPILKDTGPAGVSRTSSSRVNLNRFQVE
jgi:hypothetical protein